MTINKEALEEQTKFYEFISGYEFISKDGRLDLDAFCVNLSSCFNCDGVLSISPKPRDVYDLLIEILQKYANADEMELWVQTDWEPQHASVYPEKYRTCIHVAGLIHAYPRWIYHIGHSLMDIPEPDKSEKYYEWVRQDWVFVFSFINGFHEFMAELMKEMDKKGINDRGYSFFEALSKATKSDSDFDRVVEELKNRHTAQQDALSRISMSIESGFYLEAITLQECLISNCLFNFVQEKIKPLKNPSFHKLLELCAQPGLSSMDSFKDLINDLDIWRKNRNSAIHGFIVSRSQNLDESQENFMIFSRKTAECGMKLSDEVCNWYENESVNFVNTKFENNNSISTTN